MFMNFYFIKFHKISIPSVEDVSLHSLTNMVFVPCTSRHTKAIIQTYQYHIDPIIGVWLRNIFHRDDNDNVELSYSWLCIIW